VALDGYVFEKGSEYFKPTFEDAQPHGKSVENLKNLLNLGHTVILLSVRPQKFAEVTNQHLSKLGLGDLPVIYNCPLSKWELITPPYQGIGFRTCDSHEIDPLAADAMDRLIQ
ncbi:MAG: hypothetical protein H7Y36_00695, partial [Armatimonadetes bacterium]|nr:hypothetical protein [Akkermansiaceae bacterium]